MPATEVSKDSLVSGVPIYSSETPVLSGEDINDIERLASERRAQRVLRAVKVNLDLESTIMPTPDSIALLLEKTDEQLAIVAKLCGARVLSHEWGLWYDAEGEHREYHLGDSLSHLTPSDHIVVAEVEVIKSALCFGSHLAEVSYPQTHNRLKEGVREYYQRDRGWLLTDAGHPQFAISMEDAIVDGKSPPTLLDIEPRLEYLD